MSEQGTKVSTRFHESDVHHPLRNGMFRKKTTAQLATSQTNRNAVHNLLHKQLTGFDVTRASSTVENEKALSEDTRIFRPLIAGKRRRKDATSRKGNEN